MSRGSEATSKRKFLNETITSWREFKLSNPIDLRNSIESNETITDLILKKNDFRVGGDKKNIRAL